MTRTINQRELRNDSGEILRAVEAGESFVVTRNGVPAAQIVPLRRRTVVARDEALKSAVRLPRMDRHRFRADVDAVLDQGLD